MPTQNFVFIIASENVRCANNWFLGVDDPYGISLQLCATRQVWCQNLLPGHHDFVTGVSSVWNLDQENPDSVENNQTRWQYLPHTGI